MAPANNGKYKVETESRVATLEANHKEISRVIDEIKNNHLVHLSSDIAEVKRAVDDLKISMAKWTGGLAVAMLVIELLIKFLK